VGPLASDEVSVGERARGVRHDFLGSKCFAVPIAEREGGGGKVTASDSHAGFHLGARIKQKMKIDRRRHRGL